MFIIQNSIYRRLTLQRLAPPNSLYSEEFVVTCCSPEADNPNEPIFHNISAVAKYRAMFYPKNSANCTLPEGNNNSFHMKNILYLMKILQFRQIIPQRKLFYSIPDMLKHLNVLVI